MTLRARRRISPPTLPAPSITDVLLRGWSAPPWSDEVSCFAVFELSESQLAATWRQYRDALLIEAKRRGIRDPWGLQFDEP